MVRMFAPCRMTANLALECLPCLAAGRVSGTRAHFDVMRINQQYRNGTR